MKPSIGYLHTQLIKISKIGIFLISFNSSSFAQSATCTVHQEDKADAVLGAVKTWPMLIDWHQRYAGCDDASTSEGVSDVTATLLTTDWSGLMRLGSTFQRNKTLRVFLIRHIDTAMSEDQAKEVKIYATTKCVAGNAVLCKTVSKEVDDLLKEIK